MKHKTLIADLLCEILGSSFIAAAVHNFALAAEFPMTGFSGIAIILHRFLEIPIGISTIILNLPVAFLCYRRIGRSFLLKSFRCMLISSLFIDCVAPLFPSTKIPDCCQHWSRHCGRHRIRFDLHERILYRRS